MAAAAAAAAPPTTTAKSSPSLPWMEGAVVKNSRNSHCWIADPCPPVDRFDSRPSVVHLISQNRASIDTVRAALKWSNDPLFDINKHDDLWILRFVLSHHKNKRRRLPLDAIVDAARYTLRFRSHYHLDDMDIRFHPPSRTDKDHTNRSSGNGGNGDNDGVDRVQEQKRLKRAAACTKYLASCRPGAITFGIPDVRRGVVCFIQASGIDKDQVLKQFGVNDWLYAFLYMNEWTFQWLDYVTRTTGRLTKSVRLLLADGMSKSNLLPGQNQQRVKQAMGVMEECYPQLLEGIFVCKAPAWIQIPWRLLRPILPKRVVNKIDFVTPTDEERERLQGHVSINHLPARLGGKLTEWPVRYPLPTDIAPDRGLSRRTGGSGDKTVRSARQRRQQSGSSRNRKHPALNQLQRWHKAFGNAVKSKFQEIQGAIEKNMNTKKIRN